MPPNIETVVETGVDGVMIYGKTMIIEQKMLQHIEEATINDVLKRNEGNAPGRRSSNRSPVSSDGTGCLSGGQEHMENQHAQQEVAFGGKSSVLMGTYSDADNAVGIPPPPCCS